MQGHFLTVHIIEALCTPALDEILPAHVDPLSDLKLAGAATCLTVRASRDSPDNSQALAESHCGCGRLRSP